MSNPHFTRAQTRFDTLWDDHKALWEAGNVKASEMRDGKTIPVDYCLSTVARIVKQNTDVISKIDDIKTLLNGVSDKQFLYPQASTHISLLGCTQRADTAAEFSEERIGHIGAACEAILSDFEPVSFLLKGINILGSQLYVQVFPTSPHWMEMRQQLADRLTSLGESPISYPDKSPVHMNILRVTNPSQQVTNSYIKAIEKHNLRDLYIGEFTVSCVEYLLTDFVVSENIIQVYEEFHLRNPN